MEGVGEADVAAVLTSVTAYGGQLAAVFHNYSLLAERIPRGFEGFLNILDATVAALKEVLTLFNDEHATTSNHRDGKNVFSETGLRYVKLLSSECGTTLRNVEVAIEEACLSSLQEHKALLKQKRKGSNQKAVDPLLVKLDEKDFLRNVEKMTWAWAEDGIGECMERLYDLQLHLVLVSQVVTVTNLSQDV